MAKKLTMKMVKDLKNKKRHVNSFVRKNDDRDVSAWTCKFCHDFLNSHGAVLKGNQSELRDRCLLLKKMMHYGL